MRKIVLMAVVVGLAAAVNAAGWVAGQGVANDHATGANDRDVVFVQRGGGRAYGWRQYNTPIGLTVLPWSLPNFESSVYGARINLGWGEYDKTYGLDAGAFSVRNYFGGISANFVGNYSKKMSAGIEVGAVNVASVMRGLQIGFVNFADNLCGIQIGVLNFNATGVTLPIINVGW